MRLAAVLALAACSHDRAPIDREAARGVFEEVRIDAPPGMSDLTLDDRGVMWAISERDRQVLELTLGKPPIRHALDGIPDGVDTEGLAWLAPGQFAIGTEGADAPTASIMFAELRGDRLVATRTRPLGNAELGVELAVNHGIEALCGREGELLAACETVGKLPDGTRFAPIVRLRGDGGDVTSMTKLRLTTDKGKISAMTCTLADDGTAQVLAIERHYGVSRILKFTIHRDDREVTPVVVIDLQPILHDAFNLEGIVKLPDGRMVAINDNQGATARGPTELLVFAPR